MNRLLELLARLKRSQYEAAIGFLQAEQASRDQRAEAIAAAKPLPVSPQQAVNAVLKGLDLHSAATETLVVLAEFLAERAASDVSFVAAPMEFSVVGEDRNQRLAVAQAIGRLLKAYGYLSKGHVVEVWAVEDLAIKSVGEASQAAYRAIHAAKGGVLMIDDLGFLAQRYTPHDKRSLLEVSKVLDLIIPARECDDLCIVFSEEPQKYELLQTAQGELGDQVKKAVAIALCEANKSCEIEV